MGTRTGHGFRRAEKRKAIPYFIWSLLLMHPKFTGVFRVEFLLHASFYSLEGLPLLRRSAHHSEVMVPALCLTGYTCVSLGEQVQLSEIVMRILRVPTS